jgi:hypothetical protein
MLKRTSNATIVALVACLPLLASPTAARAGSVSDVVYLPATIEPGQGTPGCGNIGARTSADEVVGAVGPAIDASLAPFTGGLPLFTGATRIPGVAPWLKSRLGINDGPAACGTICVTYPGSRPGYWTVEAWDTGQPTALTSDGQEFGIGWSRLDRVTNATTGRNTVTCANVRNWKHDRERGFKLTVNY